MKRLVIAVAVLLLTFELAGASAQPAEPEPAAPRFAITAKSCTGCEDGHNDWPDSNQWEASGTLGSGAFLWVSPYYAEIGVRHMRLTFDGLGVATLIAGPNSQRTVGPGTVCLAYYDFQRAFVLIRGHGAASASFEDGQGCEGSR